MQIDTAILTTTLARLKPQFKQLGITRIANVTGLDTLGIHVAICIRPDAKHLSVSQGKGLTWELAQVSAIMEAVEGYHIENPHPPQLHGSYNDLLQDFPVLDPNIFPRGNFQMPTLSCRAIDWIEGLDLITRKVIYLPHVLTCLDTTMPHADNVFFNVSSNGLAAGNTLEEAICHGIHEVIERDCAGKFAQLSHEQRHQRQLKLDTIDSPIVGKLIEQLLAANIDINIWDISSAIGIHAFRCILRDTNVLRGLNSFLGCSANISKEKALIGALTEAAQSRLTFITGSRDDTFADEYERQKNIFLQPAKMTKGSYSYQACPSPLVKQNFSEQMADLLKCLTDNNYQRVVMVDHTKPELNIPVVHVFIPGMFFDEHNI